MAKKKKSKGKKVSSANESKESGSSSCSGKSSDTEAKVTQENNSPLQNDTTTITTITKEEEEEGKAATTSGEDDEKIIALGEMTIQGEQSTHIDTEAVTENSITLDDKYNDDKDSSFVTAITTTTSPSSKWGLLPDIDSSDDEEEVVSSQKTQSNDAVNPTVSVHIQRKEEEKQQEDHKESRLSQTEQGPETNASTEEALVTSPVLANDNDEDSDSDDSDDDALISPYLMKRHDKNPTPTPTSTPAVDNKIATVVDVDNNGKNIDAILEKTEDNPLQKTAAVPTITMKKKKKTDTPPKITLEEDGYNQSDRGISSGNSYLKVIRKEGGSDQKGEVIFRPESSVSLRLASVKSDLESRVIAARELQEREDNKKLQRRISAASIQWSYMKKENECHEEEDEEEGGEEKDVKDSETAESSEEVTEDGTAPVAIRESFENSASSTVEEVGNIEKVEPNEEEEEVLTTTSPPASWAPKVLSLADSDSDSDSEDEQIVPRRYGHDSSP